MTARLISNSGNRERPTFTRAFCNQGLEKKLHDAFLADGIVTTRQNLMHFFRGLILQGKSGMAIACYIVISREGCPLSGKPGGESPCSVDPESIMKGKKR